MDIQANIKKKACVVIPIYSTNLSESELISLKQCFNQLGDYDIFVVKPESLSIDSEILNEFTFSVKSFENHYFKNILGYNELMLSDFFYENFLDYEYLLICQLDAFVFSNQLEYWCNQNYDYIGSPWIKTVFKNKSINNFYNFISTFYSKKKKDRNKIFFSVGNGGFSLRKVRVFYAISKENKEYITNLLADKKGSLDSIEDVFWSFKAKDFYENFNIPHYQEALKFCIDRKPKLSIKLNNNELPFACHGFNKQKVVSYWMPIIKSKINND
jgi:hypothetical protein